MKRHRLFWACYAAIYDPLWEKPLGEKVATAIVSLVDSHGLIVADIGSGTGCVGSRFSDLGHDVVAVDLNAPMLRRSARRRLAAVVGRCEQLPLRTQSADVLVAANLLHLAGDPTATLREMARVCKRSGRLICSWPSDIAGPWTIGAYEHRLGLSPVKVCLRTAARITIGIFGRLMGLRRVPQPQLADAIIAVAREFGLRITWHQVPAAAQIVVVLASTDRAQD